MSYFMYFIHIYYFKNTLFLLAIVSLIESRFLVEMSLESLTAEELGAHVLYCIDFECHATNSFLFTRVIHFAC